MSSPSHDSSSALAAQRWRVVQDRSRGDDGRFVFAVRTTGIYCRPSCPARRPLRENVEFFSDARSARQAGYRACRRCTPDAASSPMSQWVTTLCRHLEESASVPSLLELANLVELSPSHVQRTFTREVGVSPFQYGKARRLERLRGELRRGGDVASAVYDAGFHSASVAYAQANRGLGMAPGRWRHGGRGENISYTVFSSDLGHVLVAATTRGLVSVQMGEEPQLVADLCAAFSSAELHRDDETMWPYVHAVRSLTLGVADAHRVPLDISASIFQARVWSVLQSIPAGATRSYTDVANSIGQSRAVRAVASACASNPVALVIPCHRVVRSNGDLADYRWGIERKTELLEREKNYRDQFRLEDT